MSITQIILTGLSWIIAIGIVMGVVLFFLLATWMQVCERTGNTHERKAEAQEGGFAAPAAKRRRRRTASCYQRALP